MRWLSAAWHVLRGYAWIPASVINDETGSMDDYCTCWLCKRKQVP